MKKTQKKPKPPLPPAIKKKPTWQVILFAGVVVIGLAALWGWLNPRFTLQTSTKFSAPKPEGILVKFAPAPPAPPEPSAEPTTGPDAPPSSPPIPISNKTFEAYFSHSWDIPKMTGNSSDFWLEVDLSSQTLFAYQGDILLKSFLVSTGTRNFPTVPGSFKIYAKYNYYTMRGPGYYLPDVPYSMFFYKGYSIHGTYWHHNFGTPMSHGCVNMETSAAAWLYARTSLGTPVFVHY